MSKIQNQANLALQKLLEFIIPPGMTAKERNVMARKAEISEETVRHLKRKQSLGADTLIRLLLVRGVTVNTLGNLPQGPSKISKAERLWAELGRELSDLEKSEFIDLIKYFRSKFKIDR